MLHYRRLLCLLVVYGNRDQYVLMVSKQLLLQAIYTNI
jgi:hypothetical protein